MSQESHGFSAHQRRGFTLIELLVVVSLIVLLVALLLPALRSVRDTGRDVACRSQLRQIGSATTGFLVDHDMKLYGLWGSPWSGEGEGEGSLFGSELFELAGFKPKPAADEGELLPYLPDAETVRELVRCPAQERGVFGSGVGSNGFFDYSMVQALPGARVPLLPASASVIHPATGEDIDTPMPLLVEEDPAYHINNAPCCIDFGHTSINRFGTWHPNGGGNYLAIGGSVQHLSFPRVLGPPASDWFALTPRGALRSLGIPEFYGEWNAR